MTAPLEVRNEELVRQLRAKFVPLKNKRRRTRTVFSPCALKLLETRFQSHDLYPGSNEISGLAKQIGASEASIQVWKTD
jgi:Homeodomain